MSEAATAPASWHPQGPPRAAGARAVRPRPAATLILIRRDGPKPRVLMGRRTAGHNFMPGAWVFPGGRLDRGDFHGPFATDLPGQVAAVFDAHLKPGHGRALALAAVRETFEETGLLLARPCPSRPGAGPWREFLAQGAAPDLAAIEIVARAITPPMIAKRFDTWFLMADAERLLSFDRQPDCGELDEVAWLEFEDALTQNIPAVTRRMIGEAVGRLDDPDRPKPYSRHRRGAWVHTVL